MRNFWLWVFAVILSLGAILYQRMTGPTTPVKGHVDYFGNDVSFSLPRTWGGSDGAKIEIKTTEKDAAAIVMYRRFKSHDEWQTLVMKNEEGLLIATLPPLPPAGKMMYQIWMFEQYKHIPLTEEPVVLRYKGEVPVWILIPHVLFMILSIVFSVRAGIEAIKRRKALVMLSAWATGTLLAGGLILGPIVQKFAFGAYWTGWPVGHDLTDNKTALSFIIWLIAFVIVRKNPQKRGWVLAASIVQLIIYLIPHSVFGSEIDFTQTPQH